MNSYLVYEIDEEQAHIFYQLFTKEYIWIAPYIADIMRKNDLFGYLVCSPSMNKLALTVFGKGEGIVHSLYLL